MKEMIELRNLVSGELFDYQTLMYFLRNYHKPRDKISQLLKTGSIIQIKRGLYIFAPLFRKGALSLEVVAAMLVQPSYISKEYALFYYGILPERVERITSMTTRKRRHFETSVGSFDYYSISRERFNIGVIAKEANDEGGFLIALKEKALADWIASLPKIKDKETLQFFLYEESRIDEKTLLPLNRSLLKEIANIYKKHNVTLLLEL